ncbi:MAG TPA: hypothetical protein VKA59_05235, partial [Vicinamibacterales bacterium]|nr:hypothetical protein [Vicinamibacterales bacterium]
VCVRRLTRVGRTAQCVRVSRNGLSKAAQPPVEQAVTLLYRSSAFVSEIVSRASERVDGRDVMPHAPGHQS